MKTYWGNRDKAPPILKTSALDGDEWSASRTGRFIAGEINPSIHWIGGWEGPMSGLDAVSKEIKILLITPAGNRTPFV